MEENYSRVEPEPEDENLEENMMDEESSVIGVWVNSGFGRRSYACAIKPNRMMTLTDGLVRELGIEVGDDLEWNLDEEEGVIYVKVIRRPWEAPEWLDIDEES